eukprot:5956459-Pyramimonas_sp.AAC.1
MCIRDSVFSVRNTIPVGLTSVARAAFAFGSPPCQGSVSNRALRAGFLYPVGKERNRGGAADGDR